MSTESIYIWQTIILIYEAALYYYVYNNLLTARYTIGQFRLLEIVMTVLALGGGFNRFEVFAPYRPIFALLWYGSWLFWCINAYSDSLSRKLQVIGIILAVTITMEPICRVAISFSIPDINEALMEMGAKMLLAQMFGKLWNVAAFSMLIFLWNGKRMKDNLLQALQLVCMILAQLFIAGSISYQVLETSTLAQILVFGSCILTGMMAISISLWILNAPKRFYQQWELNNRIQTAELEQLQYWDIERKRTELQHMRSEYAAQLATLKKLLLENKPEEAHQNISSVMSRLRKTKEYQYSNIPIIEAVIQKKSQEAGMQGIVIQPDIQIPKDNGIPGNVWCGIFSNLLDNAMHGTAESNIRQEEQIIHLTARTRGGYIIVKTENPSLPPKADLRPGHGNGQKILTRFAGEYDGEFWTEYKNGRYYAAITLRR